MELGVDDTWRYTSAVRLASNVSLGVHLFCVMIVTPKCLTCRHIICVTAVYERPMSSILNRFIWHAADEDAPQSPCAWTILLVCWNCYCCLCYHRENLNWTDSGSITYVINVHLDFKAFAIHDLITPLKSDTCSKIIAYVSHNYSDIDCSMVDMVDGWNLLLIIVCAVMFSK